jgi:hypothetical protein
MINFRLWIANEITSKELASSKLAMTASVSGESIFRMREEFKENRKF